MEVPNNIDDYGFLTLRPDGYDISCNSNKRVPTGKLYTAKENSRSLDDVLNLDDNALKTFHKPLNGKNWREKTITNNVRKPTSQMKFKMSRSQPSLNRLHKNQPQQAYRVRLTLSSDVLYKNKKENGVDHTQTNTEKKNIKKNDVFKQDKHIEVKHAKSRSWWKDIFASNKNKHVKVDRKPLKECKNSVKLNSSVEVIENMDFSNDSDILPKESLQEKIKTNRKKLIRFESEIIDIKPQHDLGQLDVKKRPPSLDCLLDNVSQENNASTVDTFVFNTRLKRNNSYCESKRDVINIYDDVADSNLSRSNNYRHTVSNFRSKSKTQTLRKPKGGEVIMSSKKPSDTEIVTKKLKKSKILSFKHWFKTTVNDQTENSNLNQVKKTKTMENNTDNSTYKKENKLVEEIPKRKSSSKSGNRNQRKVLVHIHTRDEMPVENGIPQWNNLTYQYSGSTSICSLQNKTTEFENTEIKDPLHVAKDINISTCHGAFVESSFIGAFSSTPKPDFEVKNSKLRMEIGQTADVASKNRSNSSESITVEVDVHNSPKLIRNRSSKMNEQNSVIKWVKSKQKEQNEKSENENQTSDAALLEKYFEVLSDNRQSSEKKVNTSDTTSTQSKSRVFDMPKLSRRSCSYDTVYFGRTFAFTGIATDKIPDVIAKKHPYLALSTPLRNMAQCLRQLPRVRSDNEHIVSKSYRHENEASLADKQLETAKNHPKPIKPARNLNNVKSGSSKKKQVTFTNAPTEIISPDQRFVPRRCFSDSDLSLPSYTCSPLKELRTLNNLKKTSPDTNQAKTRTLLTRSRSFKTDQILTRMKERMQRLEALRDNSQPISIDCSNVTLPHAASYIPAKVNIQSHVKYDPSPIMMSLPLPSIKQKNTSNNLNPTVKSTIITRPKPSKEEQCKQNNGRFMKLLEAQLRQQTEKLNKETKNATVENERYSATKQLARKAKIQQLIPDVKIDSVSVKSSATENVKTKVIQVSEKSIIGSNLSNNDQQSKSVLGQSDTLRKHLRIMPFTHPLPKLTHDKNYVSGCGKQSLIKIKANKDVENIISKTKNTAADLSNSGYDDASLNTYEIGEKIVLNPIDFAEPLNRDVKLELATSRVAFASHGNKFNVENETSSNEERKNGSKNYYQNKNDINLKNSIYKQNFSNIIPMKPPNATNETHFPERKLDSNKESFTCKPNKINYDSVIEKQPKIKHHNNDLIDIHQSKNQEKTKLNRRGSSNTTDVLLKNIISRQEQIKDTLLNEMGRIKQKYRFSPSSYSSDMETTEKGIHHTNTHKTHLKNFHNECKFSTCNAENEVYESDRDSISTSSSLEAYPGSDISSSNHDLNGYLTSESTYEEYVLSSDSTLCNHSDTSSDITITNCMSQDESFIINEINQGIKPKFHEYTDQQIEWHCPLLNNSTEL